MHSIRWCMLVHQGSNALLKNNSTRIGIQKCSTIFLNSLSMSPNQNQLLQFSTSLVSNKQKPKESPKATADSDSPKIEQTEKLDVSPSLGEIKSNPETVAQTPLEQSLFEVLEHNKNGNVAEAAAKYAQMKNEFLHEMTTDHYTKVIGSFAPKNLLFNWFKPYRDFVDMYHEAGKFRPEEVCKYSNISFANH